MGRVKLGRPTPLDAEGTTKGQISFHDLGLNHDLGNRLVEKLDQGDDLVDVPGDVLDDKGVGSCIHNGLAAGGKGFFNRSFNRCRR